MLISEAYREQNRRLHAQREDYGTSGEQWAPYVKRLIDDEGYSTVLDFGCGKGTLAKYLAKHDMTVAEFDPAVAGKDMAPEPADLVVCTDVMEHIEPVHLNAVIRELRRVTKRKLFLNIATREAQKTLDDGRNAHLIVKPADWWKAKLEKEFDVHLWEDRGHLVYGEMTPKGVCRKITRRRKITPELAFQCDMWRNEINKYADAFSKIETVRMWESIEDEAADLQVVINILEYLPDVPKALHDIARLSRKGTIITIKMDAERGEDWWRPMLEKRFRIANWQIEQGHILMVGAPGVMVKGITAIGAVDTEKRWAQVKDACARFPQRIEPKPEHERRAIVACYGPSLADTIETLREAAADPNADVISVSGSHDFLLSHGIVPRYHVECDPRPHKADNIEKPHPDVTYLIGSCVHEVLFNKLAGSDVRLWHVSTPEHAMRLVDELKESKEHVISGGGSVGLRSIPLFYALGYRDYSFFAMDCSFADDGARQWAGKHAGKRQDVVEVYDRLGRLWKSSPVLLTYATNFFETVQKVDDISVRMYGDGLLQSMCRYFMAPPQDDDGQPIQEQKTEVEA
jgi:hypothetical protein